MKVKASGRSALIIATGLFVCFAGPSPVVAASSDSAATTPKSESATPAKTARQSVRHLKRSARKPGKVVSKSADGKKSAERDVADASGNTTSKIPETIANANAQLTSANPDDSASAMTAKANTMLLAAADKPIPADAQAVSDASVVSSDQLNDVDRALQQPVSTQTVAMVSARPVAGPVMASGGDPSTWDQTSLVGKIFIAFGALLTMASAARMFMA